MIDGEIRAAGFVDEGEAGRVNKESIVTKTTMTLYRAAKDDSIVGACSFAARANDARAYLDNGAFGGPNLYRAVVEIDPATVLDLTEERDARDALVRVAEITGLDGGAIGVDEWVMHGRVSEALVAAGYLWVRLIDSFPEDCETWTWLGASSLDADEPELEWSPSWSGSREPPREGPARRTTTRALDVARGRPLVSLDTPPLELRDDEPILAPIERPTCACPLEPNACTCPKEIALWE